MKEDAGRMPDASMQDLRKDWYLGGDTFRDKLLAMLEKGAKSQNSRGQPQRTYIENHDESAEETIAPADLRSWQMPDGKELQETTRKGDPRKVALAVLIKRHTSASNIWIAERLEIGHGRSVSRFT